MLGKTSWDYLQAQKNVLQRFEKEWDPPTAPRSTPMTCYIKKRNGTKLVHYEEVPAKSKKSKNNSIQERRLCNQYNLQMNEPPVFTSRNKRHSSIKAEQPVQKPKSNGLQVTYDIHGNQMSQKTNSIQAIVLQYKGPELYHTAAPIFMKKSLFHKNSTCKNTGNKTMGLHKTFHIEMPRSRLRVGNLAPGNWHSDWCKQKKKEILKI